MNSMGFCLSDIILQNNTKYYKDSTCLVVCCSPFCCQDSSQIYCGFCYQGVNIRSFKSCRLWAEATIDVTLFYSRCHKCFRQIWKRYDLNLSVVLSKPFLYNICLVQFVKTLLPWKGVHVLHRYVFKWEVWCFSTNRPQNLIYRPQNLI